MTRLSADPPTALQQLTPPGVRTLPARCIRADQALAASLSASAAPDGEHEVAAGRQEPWPARAFDPMARAHKRKNHEKRGRRRREIDFRTLTGGFY